MPPRLSGLIGFGAILCLAAAQAEAAPESMISRLTVGGQVLMLRHALAPGFGDPSGFRLGDCSTQRNLNPAGRDQARAIGRRLHAAGIDTARVYSSQWCRCLETAKLLGLGPVTELAALNSFFERPQDRTPNLEALRAFLSAQPRHGPLIVLVTHQVTIAEIAGKSVASGEGVVLRLTEPAAFEVVGRIAFDR
jgi:broad specificity phosphatase PhoE